MVLAGAEADLLGMLDGVDAVLLVDALGEGRGIVVGRCLHVVDDVDASLVEGHGVGGGQDAVVLQLDGGGMVHAVTVDAHVVHHADVNDALLAVEVVDHSLCGGGHALEEAILVADKLGRPELGDVELLHLAARVDVSLAVGAGAADAEVLQGSAVAAHGMTLEVVEGDHEVIVVDVAAHDVVFDVGAVHDGDADFALFVHDVDLEHGNESVALDDFPVVGGGGALVLLVLGGVAVGGVALHDGAVHGVDEQTDKLGLQIVGVGAFAGGDLDGHAAFGLHAQGFVDFDEGLWADVAGHVDGGALLNGFLSLSGLVVVLFAADHHHRGGRHKHKYFLHINTIKCVSVLLR